VDGWVIKRKNFYVGRYGNAALYCGRTFKFLEKTEQHKTVPVGKIVDVVQKQNSTDKALYFKFYNHHDHRTPPPSGSLMWKYEKCIMFMSTNKANA
jgi:hypothetical protein